MLYTELYNGNNTKITLLYQAVQCDNLQSKPPAFLACVHCRSSRQIKDVPDTHIFRGFVTSCSCFRYLPPHVNVSDNQKHHLFDLQSYLLSNLQSCSPLKITYSLVKMFFEVI